MSLDENAPRLEVTVPLRGRRPRTIRIEPSGKRHAVVSVVGRPVGEATLEDLRGTAARLLRLDEDLSPFYAVAAKDAELSWVCSGAGRMIRSATVFEEVVKTICTTNCSWGLTKKMIGSLVEHLGEKATGAPAQGPSGRAFPTPAAMASVDEKFYREVTRAGYRSPYLLALSRSVAEGAIDLEELGFLGSEELSDDEVAARLEALPGVGPYAAAHIMLMLGRYSRLILDSWTRPTYASIAGVKNPKDGAIVRRFARYGMYAGLAFWLFLTRDWVEEPSSGPPPVP